MKKILLGSLFIFALAGCSKQLDYRNTELSNGMFYSKGENKPFTGKITHVPLSILPTRELDDMVEYAHAISEDDSFTKLITATSFASFLGQSSSAPAVLCDTHVKDGYLTGEANCAASGSKYKVADIEYTEGTIDGAVTLYSLKDQNENTLATADFVSGKLDGNFKVYGLKTNKVVTEAKLKNGVLDGEAKVYSKDTGNLIAQGMMANNIRDGEWKIYDPNTGKFVKTEVYKNGNVIESQAQTPASNELASFKAQITSALSTPTSQPDQASPPAAPTPSTPSSKESPNIGQCVYPKTIASKDGSLTFKRDTFIYEKPDIKSKKVMLKMFEAFSVGAEAPDGFIQLIATPGWDTPPNRNAGKAIGWASLSDFDFQELRNCN